MTSPRESPDVPAVLPTARAGQAAQRLVVIDPDLVRLRGLLVALRPDAANPYEPEGDAPVEPPPVRISDPTASWGGIPRGADVFERSSGVLERPARVLLDVLRELAELPPDARAVLRWLQAHGSLAEGPRGLYCDVGVAFQSDAQAALWARDLGARREGSYAHGRVLVWAAARAWGR